MRVLLTLEYDGTDYVGWQRQINGLSVQQVLEQALTKVMGSQTQVVGASRTDAGVHALGQRAHFDSRVFIPVDRYPLALNALLPSDVRVTDAVEVADIFHARHDAKGKEYTYRICNRRHFGALTARYSAHVPVPLQETLMAHAALRLIGRNDFRAFSAVGGSAKTFVRELQTVTVVRRSDMIVLTVRGNAFLYNMVRIIAGTLIDIGKTKLPAEVIDEALSTGNRLILGPTAPARGLELTRVFYEGLP